MGTLISLEIKAQVRHHCRLLAMGRLKPMRKTGGICKDILFHFHWDASVDLLNFMSQWPDFSGDEYFPIPADEKSLSEYAEQDSLIYLGTKLYKFRAAEYAFTKHKGNLWDKRKPYNLMRYELADWLSKNYK